MIDSYYKEHSAQYQQAKIKVIYIAYAGQVAPKGTDAAALAGRRATGAWRPLMPSAPKPKPARWPRTS